MIGDRLRDAPLRLVELDAANLRGEERWVVHVALDEGVDRAGLLDHLLDGDRVKHCRLLLLEAWAAA